MWQKEHVCNTLVCSVMLCCKQLTMVAQIETWKQCLSESQPSVAATQSNEAPANEAVFEPEDVANAISAEQAEDCKRGACSQTSGMYGGDAGS
jgi:hypothetical protein